MTVSWLSYCILARSQLTNFIFETVTHLERQTGKMLMVARESYRLAWESHRLAGLVVAAHTLDHAAIEGRRA